MNATKTTYVVPVTEQFQMMSEGLMEGLSMRVSTDPSQGGGDAKLGTLFDDPDTSDHSSQTSLWD